MSQVVSADNRTEEGIGARRCGDRTECSVDLSDERMWEAMVSACEAQQPLVLITHTPTAEATYSLLKLTVQHIMQQYVREYTDCGIS